MDYTSFKDVARGLLVDFGTSIVLHHCIGTQYNPVDLITERIYKDYTGIGAKLGYNTEAIGASNMIIEAGDVSILCQFSEEPIIDKDQIIFNNIAYNIISKEIVEPDGSMAILYKLQCRRSA